MGRRLARSAALSGLALLLAGFALAAWPGRAAAPAGVGSWLAQLVDAVAFGFVGTVILERVDGRAARVGGALLVSGWCQAVTFCTSSWIMRPGAPPAVVRWLDDWLWVPAVLATLLVLPVVFPTGLPERGFRWLWPASLAGVAIASAITAYDALPGRSAPAAGVPVAIGVVVGCVAAGLAALVLRYRRGDQRTRGQVRWLVWVLVVLVAAELVVPLVPTGVSRGALLVLPVLVPVAVGLAVLRYGLFDIDLLLTRTLTSLVLSAVLLGLYALLVIAIEQSVGGSALSRPAFLAVLVVALVAVPLWDALRWVLARRVWGPAADRERALADLTRRLAASPSLRDSPRVVTEALAEVLRAPVELLAGTTTVAHAGVPVEPVRTVPVQHAGREVGAVRVGRRPGGPFGAREERLLADVAAAVGPLLDSVLLTEELRRERARVLEVREAERTRLRRDLHDGLGPTLAGLALGVDAARNLVHLAPDRADATLVRLGELAGGATAEVRRVVDELGPHALEERPLVEAIRAHVQLDGVEPPVTVTEAGCWSLPPRAESAVLRLVLEAVTNVRRHASATRCHVRLAAEGADLVVSVDDDGRGLPAVLDGVGVGLGSMRRRVEDVGGRLLLGPSALGGTRVWARIPGGPA